MNEGFSGFVILAFQKVATTRLCPAGLLNKGLPQRVVGVDQIAVSLMKPFQKFQTWDPGAFSASVTESSGEFSRLAH